MSGALLAATVGMNRGSLPAWANISGAHASAQNAAKAVAASGAVTYTVTWADPGNSFILDIVDSSSLGHPLTSGAPLTLSSGGSSSVYFLAAASAALGPVTITVAAAEYSSVTFTVTLT